MSNQHLVQSEVVVSCSNLLNNTETKTRSAIDLPWACIFDGDGSDSAVADEPDHAVVQSREMMKRDDMMIVGVAVGCFAIDIVLLWLLCCCKL